MGQVQSRWIQSKLRTSFTFDLLHKLKTSIILTMTPTAPTMCLLIFCLSFTLSQWTCEGPDRILGTYNQVYPQGKDTIIIVTKKATDSCGYTINRLDSNGATYESWSLYNIGLDPLTEDINDRWCFNYFAPGTDSLLINFISDLDKGWFLTDKVPTANLVYIYYFMDWVTNGTRLTINPLANGRETFERN